MSGFTPGDIIAFLKEEIPEYIGTYTYTNGTVTPAIAIDNIPNDITVKGFEIIIPGFPKLPKGVQRMGRRTHICQIWDIDFINHDSGNIGSLARKGEFYLMIQHLLLVLPRTSYGVHFNQQDPMRSLQRYRLSIKLSDTYDTRAAKRSR